MSLFTDTVSLSSLSVVPSSAIAIAVLCILSRFAVSASVTVYNAVIVTGSEYGAKLFIVAMVETPVWLSTSFSSPFTVTCNVSVTMMLFSVAFPV